MSRVRTLLRPNWLLLHLVTVGLIVGMILLGHWQLTVSEHKHFNIRNFGYALQWWVFSAFCVYMWVRVVRDGLNRADGTPFQHAESAEPAHESVQYRRYVVPNSSDAATDDPERAAYNEYLARLAAKAKGQSEGTGR